MATLVRRRICASIQKSGFYSIIVDETKDLSKQEQLSIAVRYINVNKLAVMERFLTFFPARNLDAESLTKYILDTLALYSLDPKMIVSQGYDGASVMSGRWSPAKESRSSSLCHIHSLSCPCTKSCFGRLCQE